MTKHLNNLENYSVKRTKWWEIVAIIALAFIAYGNTIPNDYNIDDAFIVPLDEQNDVIKDGISAIPKLLVSRYNEGEGVTYGYRPMGKITMVFEYMFWGNNPHYSHIVNILLYAINVIMLLILLRTLSIVGIKLSRLVIYMGILLFILHPIHTEVVASIKNREEILCFTFLIFGVIMALKFVETKKLKYTVIFILSLIASMLSKQTGFNIFGWLILIVFLGWRLDKIRFVNIRSIIQGLSFIILALIIYNIIFVQVPSTLTVADVGATEGFEQNPYKAHGALLSIPNGIQTILFYIKKLIIPFPMLFYYGYDMLPIQNWNRPLPYVGLVIFAALLIYVVYSFRANSNIGIAFWLCIFAVSIFPFSNLFKQIYITGIVGERLAYQASFAFCLIVSILIANLAGKISKGEKKKMRFMCLVFLCPIVLTYTLLIFTRNQQWKDKETLYIHDIKYLSNSARANFMIANTYMKIVDKDKVKQRRNELRKAKNHLSQAINVYPEYSNAKIKLALIYGQYLNRHDSAFYYLSNVSADSSEYHLNSLELLGDLTQSEYKNTNAALKYYEEYWGINSNINKRVYSKIVTTYFNNRSYDKVLIVAQSAIDNNWLEGYLDMGDALFQLGRGQEALKYYKIATEKGPNNENLINRIQSIKSEGL